MFFEIVNQLYFSLPEDEKTRVKKMQIENRTQKKLNDIYKNCISNYIF